MVEEPEPSFEPTPPPDDGKADLDPDDISEPRAKFYVDDVEVIVTAEAVYELDPQTQQLRLVEYRDLVTETVRSLFPEPPTSCGRSGRAGSTDARSSMPWANTGSTPTNSLNVPVCPTPTRSTSSCTSPGISRSRPAPIACRRVRKEHADFFDAFQPAAREVLEHLLDKYAEYGIAEAGKPSVCFRSRRCRH